MFKKKEKKPRMEEASVELIEKEIKSYKKWKYVLLFEYVLTLVLGFIFFIVGYLHYCMILLAFVIICVQALSTISNRTQYLRFLVYIKKGDP